MLVPMNPDTSAHDTLPAPLDEVPTTPSAGSVEQPHGAAPVRSLAELRRRLSATPMRHVQRLGEALMARGVIDLPTLDQALQRQAQAHTHQLLGQLLVDGEALTEAQLSSLMADWLGVPTVDLSQLVPEPEALRRLPRGVALRETMLPLMLHGESLVVAMPDPWDRQQLDELRFICEQRILPVSAAPGSLAPAVARAYAASTAIRTPAQAGAHEPGPEAVGKAFGMRDVHELTAELAAHDAESPSTASTVVSEADNTLVRLINTLIADAIRHGASDIHIETADPPRPTRIRLRIDGDLVAFIEVPARYRFALVARLKIMADLDISEHRKPQDGKIDFARFGGPHIELRLVTVPTSRGLEDVVLRLLSGLKPLPLESIGLSRHNLEALRGEIRKTYGLVLVCGPTGCGKTTTLHSVMRELNTDKRKIWTAEDPIEIAQEGLRQVQVNPRIGWTFAAAMRTFLRADPDVVMIGEMRDEETARIAVEASLTGHLVLSTLHTNSAPESITRLLEIGLDPFAFSDSLLAILAQRLVRRLCVHCRVPQVMTARAVSELAALSLDSGRQSPDQQGALVARWQRTYGNDKGELLQYRAVGCHECGSEGYHGRLGLHELMLPDDHVRELVRHRASAGELQAAALAGGMSTLRQDGIEKVLAGLTDLSEVMAASNQ